MLTYPKEPANPGWALKCTKHDSDLPILPDMRDGFNAYKEYNITVISTPPDQHNSNSDLPLPLTSWYQTFLSLMTWKHPCWPFGETLTRPDLDSGAVATQKSSCSAIHGGI